MKFDFDNMYCGAVKRGDIFVSHESGKEEVLVVVQENILNERLSTVLGVPLERHADGKTIHRNELLVKQTETGLGHAAVALPHKMRPYDRRHLIAKKGELNPIRLKELYHVIEINFGRFRDK